MTLTFNYSNGNQVIAGIKIVMTESDGTITILTTDANGQVTLPTTSNTYTLSASFTETGDDPISLIDAIQILQYGGELRTLTADQKTAADVNQDGEVDVLDAIWILQHLGELRTLDGGLIFLDANTGKPLSETTFNPGDTPNISVVRLGDVDGDFDPSLITDHAPILTGKTTLSMDENETTVSTLVGADADGDALTYSITGGVDQDLFTINESTGVLSFKAGPDYEDPGDNDFDNLYDVEISVSDGTNTTMQALVVSVNDIGEKIAVSNKLVNEETAGATVGDLSIIDTAFGTSDITYALSGDDAQYFVLDGTTIKLKSDVSANYEVQSRYTLTVTATNAGGEEISEKVVFNVNAAPKNISITNNTILESDYGLVVSKLNISDANSNETFTYELSGDDASYFEVTDTGVLKLKDYVFADYEYKNILNVTVKVSDQGGLSVQQTFNINVTNLDYATPYAPDLWSWPWIDASNDNDINSLLMRKSFYSDKYVSFDPDNDPSTPLIMTYSLVRTDSLFSYYYYNDDLEYDIVNGSDEWEAMVDQAFEYWGIVSGITFVKITETNEFVGDIRIGLSSGDFDGAGGWSWADLGLYSIDGLSLYWEFEMSQSQDIWIRSSYDPANSSSSYGPNILIHEIGHSLGLSHPFDDDFYSSLETNTNLYTVMAYAGHAELKNSWDVDGDGVYEWQEDDRLYATKPSINDIKAIQYIYGMTPEYNHGDTEYIYKGPVYDTIYDTGGIDTIDLSSYTLNITLNLNGGTVSYIGTNELWITKPSAVGSSDSYWGSSGFPISISENTIIENAILGNGNDTITCNLAINTITCNLGNDTVYNIDIGDTIYGGGGNDIFVLSSINFASIDGGEGSDQISFEDADANGSSIDLNDYNNASITNVEAISTVNTIPTLVRLTEQSILNFNGSTSDDIDGDGDSDYYFYIYADSGKDIILLDPEEWTFYETKNLGYGMNLDFFTSDGGDTYFASTSGVGVYEAFNDDASNEIDKQTVEENLADATIGLLSPININQLSPSSSLKFTISGDDADFFEIDDAGTLKLKSGTVVDYETRTSFNVSINLGYYIGSEFIKIGTSKQYEITVINGEENQIVGQNWSVAASETIIGTSKDDYIDYDGGDDYVNGKEGNDTLLFNHDYTSAFEVLTIAGITKIRVGSSASEDYAYDDVKLINVESVKFNNTYLSLDTALPTESIIWGTTNSETLMGTNTDDLLDSAGGNDIINGDEGNDTLVIFSNSNYFDIQTISGITKFYGSTQVSYDTFSTKYFYSGYQSRMINVESIQFLDKTLTLDTTPITENIVWGTANADILIGTDDDELIDSAGGNDLIDGKDGMDTLVIFSKKDDFSSLGEIMTIGGITKMLSNSFYSGIGYEYYNYVITMINVEKVQFNDQSLNLDTALISESNIFGTSGSDILIGTDDNDLIDSAGGNDYIDGKAGNDTLAIFDNNIGFEVLTVAGITKIKSYIKNNIGFSYSDSTITMINVENITYENRSILIETILPASNFINGSIQSESLVGSADNDLFDSFGGNDEIDGGTGIDTIALFGNQADFEVITLSGLTKIYGLNSDGLAGNYWGNTIKMIEVESITFADQSSSIETTYSGNLIAWGSTSGTTIDGTDGNDVIDSGGGSDTIDGGTGDDTLLLFADKSTFDITINGDTITLTGNSSEGLAFAYWLDTITLTNVETIMFADQTVQVSDLISDSGSDGGAIENNNTDDDNTVDAPDNEDTPMDSDLPDLSFWTNDYDLSFITLPDTVVETPLVLTDALLDLIEIPSESLELIFPLNGDAIHMDKVANSAVDEINLDPLLQNDWQAVMEEYIYTSELG